MQALVLTSDRDLAHQIAQSIKPFAQSLPANQMDTALTIYKRHKPQVALVDLDIPYPGGLVTSSELRNQSLRSKHNLRIIMLARRAEPALIENARQQGVDDFILIPLDSEILAQKLKAITTTEPHPG